MEMTCSRHRWDLDHKHFQILDAKSRAQQKFVLVDYPTSVSHASRSYLHDLYSRVRGNDTHQIGVAG